MPNHVHGILLIENNKGGDNMHGKVVSKKKEMISNDFEKPSLGFIQKRMGEISPKAGSISVVIRSFKSITTKMARKINADFKWQSRFYDHIIRNDESFYRIAEYIKNNPKKWQEDRFYE